MKHILLIPLSLFYLFSYAVHATDKDVELGDWIKLTTPHIELFTDYDETQAKQVIEKITLFRSVIIQFMKGVEKPVSQPLSMVLFRNESLWRKDKLSKVAGGYFTFPIYGPLAVVGSSEGQPNLETIYHEYVHYLVDQYVPVRFPDWYNEGMAQFFETVAIEPDYIYIGAIPTNNVKVLERLGMTRPEKLFEQGRILQMKRKERAKFYASAWLTAHYFTLGARNGFPSYYQSNATFMDQVRSGKTVQQAFNDSFSISMRELDRELKQYARSKNKTGFSIDRPAINAEVLVTKLSLAETQIKLATVFGWRENNSFGRSLLLEAAKQNEPFAISIRAMHFAMDKNIESSEKSLAQLPQQTLLSAAILHNIYKTKMLLAKQYREAGETDTSSKYIDQAEKALLLSLEKDPYMPSMMANLKRLVGSDKSEGSAAAERLLVQFGNHFQAQLTASRAYIALGQLNEALACLHRVINLLPHTQTNEYLQSTIAKKIAEIEQQLSQENT